MYWIVTQKYPQAKLSASGDESWKDREAAVLALGAVAEGCIDGLYPHLSQVIIFWSLKAHDLGFEYNGGSYDFMFSRKSVKSN